MKTYLFSNLVITFDDSRLKNLITIGWKAYFKMLTILPSNRKPDILVYGLSTVKSIDSKEKSDYGENRCHST